MTGETRLLGIITTDERLIVRTWDVWIAQATGVDAARALNQPLVDLLPDIVTRGVLPVLESALARGTVEVLAPALHHYLFACAPSVPSRLFDRMQQHVTIGPLRDGTRIAGLAITVEDVTARMERERQVTDELASPSVAGSAARAAATETAPDALQSLTQRLGDEDWRARQRAVTTLVEHGPTVVDAVVMTLREQHRDFNVLSSILDLLAISEIDIVDPLTGLLGDDDPNLRLQAALMLGERRDPRAIGALMARLEDPDANVQFHVIEALGRLRATEAADGLVRIAERRDFFLAFPAIQALSRLADPSVAPRIVPLLADELLRTPAIEALGELGDEDVAVPLVELLNTSDAPAEVIADALAGLFDRYEHRYAAGEHIGQLVRRSISAGGTQRILDAVQRVSGDRLTGLATVLGWLEGDAVQRALTRLLGQRTVRAQVLEALVRNGAGVVSLLIEQLRSDDLDTRLAAAVALGRIGDRRATDALVAALDDPELSLAAAGALAKLGDRRAFDALIARLSEPDPAVRQACIAALNSIGHPDMPARILALLDDPHAIVRESAVRIAGYFGYGVCLDRVLACSEDKAEAVRRTAVEHLAYFDDPRVFARVAHALAHDTAPVRTAAVTALARIPHADRTGALVGALDDPDPWVRYMAVRSLGAIADVGAVPAIVTRLRQDPAGHVRLAAIDVIGRLKPAEALDILEPLTRLADEDAARAAIVALGHVDRDEVLPILERSRRAPEPWRRLATIEAMAGRTEPSIPELLQWMAAADAHADVVAAAIDALSRLALRADALGTDATRALIALTAEPSRREAAVAALGNLPARRIADLAGGLQHASIDVRRACVEALGRMKHAEASRAAESALDDGSPLVRLAAVAELKRLGTRSPQRKLMTLARTDPDVEVRRAAMRAVSRVDESRAEPFADRP
jgi:HEAT repeat protein